jgi:hypothetical protein
MRPGELSRTPCYLITAVLFWICFLPCARAIALPVESSEAASEVTSAVLSDDAEAASACFLQKRPSTAPKSTFQRASWHLSAHRLRALPVRQPR